MLEISKNKFMAVGIASGSFHKKDYIFEAIARHTPWIRKVIEEDLKTESNWITAMYLEKINLD